MSRRIPPHDLDAERSVIGAALVRQQVVENLKHTLDPGDFYGSQNATIWQAMLDMHDVGEPIDVVTVAARVAGQGVDHETLVQAMAEVPSVSAHEQYAKTVVEASRRRRLLSHLATLAQRGELAFSPERIGRWWNDHEEIAVVALNQQSSTLLVGECDWRDQPANLALLNQLRHKAAILNRGGEWKTIRYALFSKCGFTADVRTVADVEGILLVSIDQMTNPLVS